MLESAEVDLLEDRLVLPYRVLKGTQNAVKRSLGVLRSFPDMEIVGQPVSEADRNFLTLQKVSGGSSFL